LSPALTAPAGIAKLVALDDIFSFEPNTLTVSPPGVLLNDLIDPSCPLDQVKVQVIKEPEFGTLELTRDGGFKYTVRVPPVVSVWCTTWWL
jgi:hypothetical protein